MTLRSRFIDKGCKRDELDTIIGEVGNMDRIVMLESGNKKDIMKDFSFSFLATFSHQYYDINKMISR